MTFVNKYTCYLRQMENCGLKPLIYTKEALDPIAQEAWRLARLEIRPELSARLRSMRFIGNHGSYRDVFLFDTWDTQQCGVFDKKHFKYCLAFDPAQRKRPGQVYFHLWINRTRLYQEAERLRTEIDAALRKVKVPGFALEIIDRYAELIHIVPGDLNATRLPAYLAPKIATLVNAAHPLLIPIIESFLYTQTKEERAAEIGSRTRAYTGPCERRPKEEIRQYTRSIPSSMRSKVYEAAQGKCQLCGRAIDFDEMHVDHILPFARGGMTVIENLQATCAPCNLSKGKRSEDE